MMGQNSFSDTFSNSNNAPINVSVPNTPSDTNQSVTKKTSPKTIIIAIVGLIFGIAITTLIFLLFINPANNENNAGPEIQQNSIDNDGTKTMEEMLSEFDSEINSATDEETKLDLILDKSSYYMLNNDYNSAITTLDTISVDTLDNGDKQIVYNYYSTAYEGKGDTAQASRYKQLADEALDKAYSEEDEEE